MKQVILGDTHGRTMWKQILEIEKDFDRVVFIGDYIDTHESVTPLEQMERILSHRRARIEQRIFGDRGWGSNNQTATKMKSIILGLLLLLSPILSVEAPSVMKTVFLPTITIEAKTYEREIFDTAIELGADSLTAKILVAQARFESGGFSNQLTVIHNNIYSMQHPRLRETTSLGALATAEGRPDTYASYSSVREAVVDLFLYFDARNIDLRQHSVTRYVYLLKRKAFFEAHQDFYKKGVWKEFKKTNV